MYNIYYWLKYIWLCKILRNERAYYEWADKEITKVRIKGRG